MTGGIADEVHLRCLAAHTVEPQSRKGSSVHVCSTGCRYILGDFTVSAACHTPYDCMNGLSKVFANRMFHKASGMYVFAGKVWPVAVFIEWADKQQQLERMWSETAFSWPRHLVSSDPELSGRVTVASSLESLEELACCRSITSIPKVSLRHGILPRYIPLSGRRLSEVRY